MTLARAGHDGCIAPRSYRFELPVLALVALAVANACTERQHGGFFGIGTPTASGLWSALAGNRGLLVVSLCAATGLGLVLLWRRGLRLEAAVAGATTIAFVALDAGYFLPYGGTSPGPRFLVPAIPFLALGLPAALARFPRATFGLAIVSAVLTSADTLTWSLRGPSDGSFVPTRHEVAVTLWSELGASRPLGALVVATLALGALAVGGRVLQRAAA